MNKRLDGLAIVIPSRDEGDELVATVKSVLRTEAQPDQITVMDDGSSDGSADNLASEFGINVIHQEWAGLSRTKNSGAAQTEGEFLVFLDAHSRPHKGWLHQLRAALAFDPDVAVAGARTYPIGKPDAWGAGWNLIHLGPPLEWRWDTPRHLDYAPIAQGGAQMWRRDAFNDLGGFTELMYPVGSEDSEISIRAWRHGYAVTATPHAHVGHMFKAGLMPGIPDQRIPANEMILALLNFTPEPLRVFYEAHAAWPDEWFVPMWETSHAPEVMAAREREMATEARSFDWWATMFNPALLTPWPARPPSYSEDSTADGTATPDLIRIGSVDSARPLGVGELETRATLSDGVGVDIDDA